MKLTCMYKTVTIESSLTKAELVKALQYTPTACTLVDADNVPVFGISIVKAGNGIIGPNGIDFAYATADGKLYNTVTLQDMPEDAAAKTSFLQEKFGPVLFKLKALEDQIKTALEAQAADIASVANAIEVL